MTYPSHVLARALRAVGELLDAEGVAVELVVVGGAALSLGDFIDRTTADIDILAVRDPVGLGSPRDGVRLLPPDPLPTALVEAARTVARDMGLPLDWMNTDIAAQWHGGLPPRIEQDLTWHRFAGLRLGLAGRRTLIALKLFAAVDQGPRSVHFQDLRALHPSRDELDAAAVWVKTQDAAPDFPRMVDEVVEAALQTSHADGTA